MTLQISQSCGFKNGSVQRVRAGLYGEVIDMYVVHGKESHTLHTLKRTWIGQIIQVFILRIKHK